METKILKHYGVEVEATYVDDNDMYKNLVKNGIEYIDIPNSELVDVVSYIKDGVKKYLVQGEGFWFKTLSVPDDGSWRNLVIDMKKQFYGAEAMVMASKLARDIEYVRTILDQEEETEEEDEELEFDDSFESFGIKDYTEEELDDYWGSVILELKSRCGWTKERMLKADKYGIGKRALEMLENHL